MKGHIFLLTMVLNSTLSLAIDDKTASDREMKIKQEGLQYIKILGGALKSQLQTYMKTDKSGLSAMAFCTAKATDITQEVNTKLPAHASVRRTALKTRNENNLPDEIDIKVMEAYEASITDRTFSLADIKIVEDGNSIRIYKPLITQGVCLKCHGNKINKDIQSMITTHYPKDKAVGFEEGSLRGVIVTEIKDQLL